jgi:hypothetical protein
MPDPVLLRALQLVQGGLRGDEAAVLALALAATQGRPPRPQATCARDGSAPAQPLQQASYTAFTSGNLCTSLPTLAAVRKQAMQAAEELAPCPELKELQKRLEASDKRPRADDPYDLCRRIPFLAPVRASSVQLPPRQQRPEPGKLSTLDPAGFLAAHTSSCERCTRDAMCSIPALAGWVGGLVLPFLEGHPQQASLRPHPSTADDYDPVLAGLVTAMWEEGTLEQSDDVLNYSSLFIAWKASVKLTREQEDSIKAGGSPAALAVASTHASTFLEAYKASLQPSLSGSAPPSSKQVKHAWEQGDKALGSEMKPRVVTDLSRLTASFCPCRLQYATLQEFMSSLRKGQFIVKCDLRSGFHQVPASLAARRYFGAHVRLAPGAPPTSLRYTRLPMGVHPAPFAFSAITAEVLRLVRVKTGVKCSGVYIDDLYFACDSQEEAARVLDALKEVLAQCGLEWSRTKTSTTPVTNEIILGVQLDTQAMTASLPAAKQVKTLTLALILLQCAREKIPVPESALGEMGGRLTWWGSIFDLIPSNTRSLASFAKYKHGSWRQWRAGAHTWGEDAPTQISELQWLVDGARDGSLMGTSILAREAFLPQRAIYFTVDASGSSNAVGIVSELGALRVSLPDCGSLAIPVMELLAPALVYMLYGKFIAGLNLLVVIGSDASGACHWMAKGRAARDDANDLLRLIRAAADRTGSLPLQMWLSRWFNFKADRVAAIPIPQLLQQRTVHLGLAEEITISGLPHEFMAGWAQEVIPSFAFSTAAWLAVNPRA